MLSVTRLGSLHNYTIRNLISRPQFDTSNHPRQGHTIAVSRSLRPFLSRDPANSIQFWDCPSEDKWLLHYKVDQQAKLHLIPVRHPNKEFWEFCRQYECKDLTKEWQMLFENAPYKGSQFLDTYDDDGYLITPSYAKGGSWLNTIGISNSICAELQDLSRITPPLASTKPDFSQEKLTPAPVTTHSWRPDITSCESVHVITTMTWWGMSLAKLCSS